MSKNGFLQVILDLIPFGIPNKIRHLPLIKKVQAGLVKMFLEGREFTATISGGV